MKQILKNGIPLNESLYFIDYKNKIFYTKEHYLDIAFVNDKNEWDCTGWTFIIGSYCKIKIECACVVKAKDYCEVTGKDFNTIVANRYNKFILGKDCIINSGGNCTFKVKSQCIIKTGANSKIYGLQNTVVFRKDTREMIDKFGTHKIIKINPCNIKGFTKIKCQN